MSTKRSRAHFEADLQAQQSPYVLYGTPLPAFDPEIRDDGSYVPAWKQEERDERGRKRLHGAFTGGWSAGYFNTVGSKEGWAPSNFVSSRTNRRKDGAKEDQSRQRVEDFMDEEDLADRAEAEKLQTASSFAGLGSTDQDAIWRGGLSDLFRAQGETMGVKLLKRMGWKDGQGIGPKVRRKARLGQSDEDGETHLFAPENVAMVALVKKIDRKGLGFDGEERMTPLTSSRAGDKDEEGSDEDAGSGPLIRPAKALTALRKDQSKPIKGGIGIGILNDTGSDDEDPYEIGPRISYNRTIGADKKKEKKKPTKKALAATTANPSLRSAPTFVSRKIALDKVIKDLRKCHDGRLPLDGFVLATRTEDLAKSINTNEKYPPPTIPPGWKSSKQPRGSSRGASSSSTYVSTADAAKASTLDQKSRAELLGEAVLPGKSVFDFLSPAARERLAGATGRTNLPPALGEVPAGYALSPEEKQRQLFSQVPQLEKDTAIAALARGTSGSAPYADNDAKRTRYRAYLEYSAGFNNSRLPTKSAGVKDEDFVRELREFHGCAKIFKPMTGMMASRFTTSSSSSKLSTGSQGNATDPSTLLARPPPKPTDPAEEAAKMGMYGSMTRSVTDFYPTRLLCKRFNVRPPAHVQPDGGTEQSSAGGSKPSGVPVHGGGGEAITLDELVLQAQGQSSSMRTADVPMIEGVHNEAPKTLQPAPVPVRAEVKVDANVNQALEGKRAQEDVLKAIFGDSDDEE